MITLKLLSRLFSARYHKHNDTYTKEETDIIFYTRQQFSGDDKTETVVIDGGNA